MRSFLVTLFQFVERDLWFFVYFGLGQWHSLKSIMEAVHRIVAGYGFFAMQGGLVQAHLCPCVYGFPGNVQLGT